LVDPPSGLKPAATAMASISVDLRVPLSPATKEIAGSSSSRPAALAQLGNDGQGERVGG
jgi:hypothetical protein